MTCWVEFSHCGQCHHQHCRTTNLYHHAYVCRCWANYWSFGMGDSFPVATAGSRTGESRGSDTYTDLIINSDNPERSPMRFLMGPAMLPRQPNRLLRACVCVCRCHGSAGPCWPGLFRAPMFPLSLFLFFFLPLLALQLVVAWAGLNWCLYGFRHAQLQLQATSLALKWFQLWKSTSTVLLLTF